MTTYYSFIFLGQSHIIAIKSSQDLVITTWHTNRYPFKITNYSLNIEILFMISLFPYAYAYKITQLLLSYLYILQHFFSNLTSLEYNKNLQEEIFLTHSITFFRILSPVTYTKCNDECNAQLYKQLILLIFIHIKTFLLCKLFKSLSYYI